MAAPRDMAGATPDGSQDAGYFRGLLLSGQVPQAADIELEGFLSEHDIPFTDAACDQVLCMSAMLGRDQVVADNAEALFIQLAMASNVDLESRSRMPVNLAVVVDVSGSMLAEGKLEYVKDGLLLMVAELGPEDRLALVTYSTRAQVIVPSQYVANPAVFTEAISALVPSGSTNLYDGMVLGYEEVAEHVDAQALARVMLLSDGLANVGVSANASILARSAEYNGQGIGITTIGVGLDFNQDLMRDLSEQGGGNFYFIETPEKITAVFKDELDFLVTPLANNLDITVSFAEGFGLADVYGLAHDWDEDGNMTVHVPTVFASRRGGAILIRVENSAGGELLAGEVVTAIAYSYEPLADDGTVLAAVSRVTDARVPVLDESGQGFATPAVHKSMVLWNMVNSFHAASNAYYMSADRWTALDHIERLATYVDGANEALEDEELARDRAELINQFAINLGGWIGDPRYFDEPMPDCCWNDDISEGSMFPFPFGCAAFRGTATPGLLIAVVAMLTRRRRAR